MVLTNLQIVRTILAKCSNQTVVACNDFLLTKINTHNDTAIDNNRSSNTPGNVYGIYIVVDRYDEKAK